MSLFFLSDGDTSRRGRGSGGGGEVSATNQLFAKLARVVSPSPIKRGGDRGGDACRQSGQKINKLHASSPFTSRMHLTNRISKLKNCFLFEGIQIHKVKAATAQMPSLPHECGLSSLF